jgi:hypothetical protein
MMMPSPSTSLASPTAKNSEMPCMGDWEKSLITLDFDRKTYKIPREKTRRDEKAC